MITAAASRSNLRRPAIPCSPRSDRVWRQTGSSGGGALCPSPEAYVERHKKHARSPVVKWAASSANISAGHSSSKIVTVSHSPERSPPPSVGARAFVLSLPAIQKIPNFRAGPEFHPGNPSQHQGGVIYQREERRCLALIAGLYPSSAWRRCCRPPPLLRRIIRRAQFI